MDAEGQQMANLPLELWFYIAEFIPPSDLPKLAGVNRVFFELIMSELYSQLSFISSDPHVFSEKLASLQSPGLAERVRVLTLWPGAVRDAIKAKGSEKHQGENNGRTSPNPKSKHAHYLLKGRNYVGELLGHRRTPSLPIVPPVTAAQQLPPPEERREMFLATIRKLNHIEELELSWYIDTGRRPEAWSFSYFPEIWQSIAQNLRKLTIDIQISKLADAGQNCVSLPQLQELHLTLRSNIPVGVYDDTYVPYFINKFSPSVRYLSIKTIGHQELSQIFELLGMFPYLARLAISMPLDYQHLKDPQGLHNFLQNHPQITQLSIRYTRCCTYPVCDGFEAFDGTHRIYSDISLPALNSLELGLYLPLSDKNNSLYQSIARLGDDLTSLTVQDRSLKLEEIKILLKIFPSHRLKKLSLFAQLLSPQLIDHIAQVCPALNSLSLDVDLVVKSETLSSTVGYPYHLIMNDMIGFEAALTKYAVDLDNDRWRYRTWVLSDISIMKWESAGHVYIWECMDAIAYVVPAVRSFAGRGHMTHDSNSAVSKPSTQRRFLDIGDRNKPLDT